MGSGSGASAGGTHCLRLSPKQSVDLDGEETLGKTFGASEMGDCVEGFIGLDCGDDGERLHVDVWILMPWEHPLFVSSFYYFI